jgi:hypothetical protein
MSSSELSWADDDEKLFITMQGRATLSAIKLPPFKLAVSLKKVNISGKMFEVYA